MTALWLIVLCGVLAIVYAVWAIRSVLAADPGSPRMQEISAAVREGAQAYLKRQYATIGVAGIVIFFILAYFLGWSVRNQWFKDWEIRTSATARSRGPAHRAGPTRVAAQWRL